jgi:PAS domain-containing protein
MDAVLSGTGSGRYIRPAVEATSSQKSIVLILARELASNVATPIFLVDKAGMLVFYNEAAELLVGQPFAAVGEMPALEWGSRFAPEDLEGQPLALDTLPPAVANLQQRAAHLAMQVTTGDGSKRIVDVAAFPLFARADEFVGTIAIFWDHHTGRAS